MVFQCSWFIKLVDLNVNCGAVNGAIFIRVMVNIELIMVVCSDVWWLSGWTIVLVGF